MDRDYEKAYKAVLKTAQQWIEDGCTDKERICLESVFPELRESEDERIRKALIDGVRQIRCKNGITQEQMLAYLKKQKEQKQKFNSGDVLKCKSTGSLWVRCKGGDNRRSDGHTACIGGGYVLASKDEAEQFFKELDGNGYTLDVLNGEPIKKEQKPAEWSEEDRLHYANVLEALEYVKGCKSDYDKIEAVKSDIAWLKSLRHQPHWKPSEEQMRALLKVVDKARELHYSSNSGYDEYDVLRLLYKQLKEL